MNNIQKKQKPLWPLVLLNLILACILIYVLYFLFAADGKDVKTPVSTIPAFSMQSFNEGESFDLSTFDTSGPFIINIFASWCLPCEAEHPVLTDLANNYAIPIYGVAMQDEKKDLQEFLKRLGNPYQAIGMDNAGLMLPGLGVRGLPSTFVVDQDMKVQMVYEGPITQPLAEKKIIPLIEKLRSGD